MRFRFITRQTNKSSNMESSQPREKQEHQRQENPASDQEEQTICPICQDSIQDACETSCGHFFCGKCLSDYWNSLPSDSPKKCPLDRKVVTFVIPSHGVRQRVHSHQRSEDTTSEQRLSSHTTRRVILTGDTTSSTDIDRELLIWNRVLNAQSRPFLDWNENAHLLHRFYEGTEDEHPPVINKIILFLVLFVFFLYFLMPFDLIADSIPVIGFLDDIILPIFTLLFILPRLYRLYITSRAFADSSASTHP